jgi:hypothetical protein
MAGTITSKTTSRKGRGIVRIDVSVSYSTSMAAVAIGQFYGRLVRVLIDPAAGAGSTMTSTTDVLLTDGDTGAPILSDLSAGAAAAAYRPTEAITDNAGVAVTPAVTANDVNRDIFVAGTVKLALANGGASESGLISLIFEEAQ